jgi:hypothetical protein
MEMPCRSGSRLEGYNRAANAAWLISLKEPIYPNVTREPLGWAFHRGLRPVPDNFHEHLLA